jgi:antirestriction protein ArdC
MNIIIKAITIYCILQTKTIPINIFCNKNIIRKVNIIKNNKDEIFQNQGMSFNQITF